MYVVSTVVFGYHRLDKRKRIIDTHDVYMDPIVTKSTGVWAAVPKSGLDQMSRLNIDPMAGIHAACKYNITRTCIVIFC